jgi:hypothetical protein
MTSRNNSPTKQTGTENDAMRPQKTPPHPRPDDNTIRAATDHIALARAYLRAIPHTSPNATLANSLNAQLLALENHLNTARR